MPIRRALLFAAISLLIAVPASAGTWMEGVQKFVSRVHFVYALEAACVKAGLGDDRQCRCALMALANKTGWKGLDIYFLGARTTAADAELVAELPAVVEAANADCGTRLPTAKD